MRQRLRDHGLILEWTARPGEELVQDKPGEEEPEFWKLIDVEPVPEPPPPTPEGDRIALAALDEIHGLFSVTDPKLGQWIAESEEASIYNAHLHYEKGPPESKE